MGFSPFCVISLSEGPGFSPPAVDFLSEYAGFSPKGVDLSSDYVGLSPVGKGFSSDRVSRWASCPGGWSVRQNSLTFGFFISVCVKGKLVWVFRCPPIPPCEPPLCVVLALC